MRFVKNYVGKLAAAGVIGIAALAYFNQETPLEQGHYKGTIDGSPAVLQVKYKSERIRDCTLQVREGEGVKTSIDYFCNDKKGIPEKVREWVNDENKVSFEEAQKHLGQ